MTVASNDDGGQAPFGFNSKVTFPAVSGTAYTIWVGSFSSGSTGSLSLSYYPSSSAGAFVLVAPPQVSENQGNAAVTVRHLRPGSAANVTLSTGAPSSGTAATAGADFTALSTTLSFGAGVMQLTTAQVPILNDDLTEGTESFGLAVSGPTAGAVLGSPSTADVAILDQSGTSAPGFSNVNLRVKEGAGVISVPLVRTRDLGGVTSIFIAPGSDSDSAQLDRDYWLITTSFTVEAGQSVVDLPVQILNDGIYRGERSFTLLVSTTTPGASVVGNSTITITIDDDDLVVPAPGRVSGVYDAGALAASVDFTVSATGAITGKVTMARGMFSFTGTLNAAGYLVARLGPTTGPLRTIQIQLLNTDARTYQVKINDGDLGTSETADLTATNFTALTPCPVAGKFTYVDLGISGVPQQVAGLITVSTLGSATLSGRLFDGTPLVATGTVTLYNVVNVGASLYGGKGRVLMSTILPTAPETILGAGASFKLLRPGRANQTVELPALDSAATGRVAKYVPPPVNTRILNIWSAGTGNADLSGGGFAALTTKAITISTQNKVTVTTPLPEKLALTLNAATGMITGTVIPTSATTPKAIYGYLLQGGGSSFGRGFFLNGITPGRVVLRGP